MNKYLVCVFLMFLPLLLPRICIAQQQNAAVGKSEIIQDPRVDILMHKHVQINQAVKTIDGFRIQVFSDSGNNSKTRAQAAHDEFQSKYPGTGVYLTFKSPNYKVRIGDFRTKLDAQRFLNDISADYPNAFIISDQINLPKTD
jgi:hypothetical protein